MFNKRAIAEEYFAVAVVANGSHPYAVLRAYHKLAEECKELARQVRETYDVTEVANGEPYENACDMFVALNAGQFEVSNLFCEHPIWTPEENVNFRITHDVYGHFGSSGTNLAPFSWEGEQNAYLSQCIYHSRLAQEALFTEVIGQTACFSLTREFPEQKAILLESRHG